MDESVKEESNLSIHKLLPFLELSAMELEHHVMIQIMLTQDRQ